jgi:hypothetical protein
MNFILSHDIRSSMALAKALELRPTLTVPVAGPENLAGVRGGNLILWGGWWRRPHANEVIATAKQRGMQILEVSDDRSR